MPAVAGRSGLALSALAARPALLPGLAGTGLLLASAALDGPVPRYRYPLDPLIALFAAGALAVVGRWLMVALRGRRAVQRIPAGALSLAEASR